MTSLAEDLAGTLAVDVSRRASQAITLATAICESDGYPLNELQLGALIQATISCYDGLEASLTHHISVEADLRTGGFARILGWQPDE